MFRDTAQHHRACRAICALAYKAHLWQEDGPTSAVAQLIHEDTANPWPAGWKEYYSSSQELLVRIALDVWNGHGHADFGQMLGRLDNRNLTAIAELMIAVIGARSHDAIDRWIETYQPKES